VSTGDDTTTEPGAQLVALRSPAGTALVAATVIASMVGFLDAYMINVAVPAIGRDLDASVSELQWVLTGYLVTVAAFLLLAASIRSGIRRRIRALASPASATGSRSPSMRAWSASR
jgi:MFS family permease